MTVSARLSNSFGLQQFKLSGKQQVDNESKPNGLISCSNIKSINPCNHT